ncbi:MAG TPA: MFS transporter [Blastocatellia bacterium]|nr:MFS transporter [Blastocatellia bacterium]
MSFRNKAWFALAVLFAINTMNFFDRQILGAVGETIRDEWKLSDTALGSLGTAFTLLYAAVGVPLGRLTDKFTRKWLLALGVTVWSAFTWFSGIARNFSQLFYARLGVGVGEAVCAPASTSLIGDLFPASKRGRALSIFMFGLPLGIALSYFVSSWVEQKYNWRAAFYIATIPGLVCALFAMMMREPKRGASEVHNISNLKREGSPYLLVLSIPTMWWIIASGALHNFNMYAIGAFLAPFLRRVHHLDKLDAGLVSMVAYGLSGIPGLFLGGIIGDAIMRRKANGRLLVGSVAVLISVPLVYLALGRPVGDTVGFTTLMTLGLATMYVYYSTVYSTIQDVIEPSLRGTAMAIYFFAMYVLGASLGPVGMGALSNYFTERAAIANGVTDMSFDALKPYAPQGLHSALYIIPVLSILLALVLFAGSRTVIKDMDKLQHWMRESARKQEAEDAKAEAAL